VFSGYHQGCYLGPRELSAFPGIDTYDEGIILISREIFGLPGLSENYLHYHQGIVYTIRELYGVPSGYYFEYQSVIWTIRVFS
jgi:hypothetical protein